MASAYPGGPDLSQYQWGTVTRDAGGNILPQNDPQAMAMSNGMFGALGNGYMSSAGQAIGGRYTTYGGAAGAGGAGGGSAGGSQSSAQMIPGMESIYKQLLGINQERYSNVQQAYNQGQNRLSEQLPGIYQGYNQLSGDVMNTLGMGQVLGKDGNWGVAGPAAEAIKRQDVAQQGQITQDMTNRGLGNTSVGGNLQNQRGYNTEQAYGGLGAQLAQTAAGYQSQIGLGGLGARMQGAGMQTGLTQGALGPLGQQASNTAGQLTGQTSSSYSNFAPQQLGGGYGSGYRPSNYGGYGAFQGVHNEVGGQAPNMMMAMMAQPKPKQYAMMAGPGGSVHGASDFSGMGSSGSSAWGSSPSGNMQPGGVPGVTNSFSGAPMGMAPGTSNYGSTGGDMTGIYGGYSDAAIMNANIAQASAALEFMTGQPASPYESTDSLLGFIGGGGDF